MIVSQNFNLQTKDDMSLFHANETLYFIRLNPKKQQSFYQEFSVIFPIHLMYIMNLNFFSLVFFIL